MENNAVNSVSGNSSVGRANTVLDVQVESLKYTVPLDVLHVLFKKYGAVQRIVTFETIDSLEVLIQYADAHSAAHAKTILDGRDIYRGCCTLRIELSKLTKIHVIYNNEQSRDFTNPYLPPGEPTVGNLLMTFPNSITQIASSITWPLTGGYNSGLPNLRTFDFENSDAMQITTTSVLFVSNLNKKLVTLDGLFTLFGVYGNVIRVKILFFKRNSSLIQMETPQQANLAMTHLNNVCLWGKPLYIRHSIFRVVLMPQEDEFSAGLNRDYINSSLHRFKKIGSRNFLNVYRPSVTLHISNIPPSFTEKDIRDVFTENNFQVKGFQFISNVKRMALVQLFTIDEAILALISLDNNKRLRLNFAKVQISKTKELA